jgi:hypothetical protein
MKVLFGILFFAWIGLSLVWLATFVQRGRTPWAKRGYRYRRVRWATAIAATACFILLSFVAQGLPPNKPSVSSAPAAGAPSAEAGAAPSAAAVPADEATSSTVDIAPPAQKEALSDSEMQYVKVVQDQAGQLSESMQRFHDLAANPEVFDDDWKLNLAKELAIWQIIYSDAQKLQPSARLAAVQDCWIGALRDLNNAASEIASGLDHSDVEEINVANGAILRSNGTVEACAQEIGALTASVSP